MNIILMTPMDRVRVGNLVKRARLAKKMNVASLGTKLGQPNEFITKLERGAHNRITAGIVAKLEEILGIDLHLTKTK